MSDRHRSATRSKTLALALVAGAGWILPPTAGGEEDRRVLAVNAVDRDGHQVSGLNATRFRAEFRGRAATVVSATEDTAPRRIAVLVDTSGSLQREKADLVWGAAVDIVASLAPAHSLAILTLGRQLHDHSGLTNDRAALESALMRARAQGFAGPSALYDGVVHAARGFSAPALGDAVYLISDGEDTASTLLDSQAQLAAARAGARVFVALVPGRASSSQGRGFSQADYWTRAVAEATGGRVVRSDRSDATRAVGEWRLAYPLIERFYRLEVAFPLSVDKPREWKLEVVDEEGRRAKGIELVYPRLLVPSQPK